jgi:hypothetical protein
MQHRAMGPSVKAKKSCACDTTVQAITVMLAVHHDRDAVVAVARLQPR